MVVKKIALMGIVAFLSLMVLSISSVSAALTLSVGNISSAPINNMILNFSWTNSTPVFDVAGTGYNSTGNVTFHLPTGIFYRSSSGSTNLSSTMNNISQSSESTVIFGNGTTNDTSTTSGWFAFNISASKSDSYTITINETYINNRATDVYTYNNTLGLYVANGTITMTNAVFSNYTYNGNSITMNFTGTPSSPTGGGTSDNITFNLYMNGTLDSTNYTCGPTCTDNRGIISYTNAIARTYTFVFNTSGTGNYSATSWGAVLVISKGTMDLSITGGNVRYPARVTVAPIVGSSSGVADVNFSFWRGVTLVSSAFGSAPATDMSTLSSGIYSYNLNTTGLSFANWTVNATGVSLSITVLEEGGSGLGGGITPTSTTTTTTTTLPLYSVIPTSTTMPSLEEIASNEWWQQTTFGVANWVLVAIGIIIVVIVVLWKTGMLEDIYDEITK